jgi:hypothetical protein
MTPQERAVENFNTLSRSFMEAGTTGRSLTIREMFRQPEGEVHPRKYVMARRLVEMGYADRSQDPPYTYRLEDRGWALLNEFMEGKAGPGFIYTALGRTEQEQRYGTRPDQVRKEPPAPKAVATKESAPCTCCGRAIHDRRITATTCWGCESTGRRVQHGGDHHPRTHAYYDKIGRRRARAERARLRQLGREQAEAGTPELDQIPVSTRNGHREPHALETVTRAVEQTARKAIETAGRLRNQRAASIGPFNLQPMAPDFAGALGQLAGRVDQQVDLLVRRIQNLAHQVERLSASCVHLPGPIQPAGKSDPSVKAALAQAIRLLEELQ